MSTNRGCAEPPSASKAKILNPGSRAEGVAGFPMFALPPGAPGPSPVSLYR
jgi:hypothetical protein